MGTIVTSLSAPKAYDFSVEFPELPGVKTEALPTPVGSMTQHSYKVTRIFRTSFLVEYIDLPSVKSDDSTGLMEQIRNEIATKSGAAVLKSNEVKTDGVPGQDMVLKDRIAGTIRIRTYLLGTRLYLIQAGTLPKSLNDPEIDRFFASYKFIQ